MRHTLLMSISAIYMALIGIGHLFAPVEMSAGAIPVSAVSTGLIAFLRHYAALFIAIATMNWLARSSAPSAALRAILWANLIVYGGGAILDVWAVLGGAGLAGLMPASINLIFTLAFLWSMRTQNLAQGS